MIDDVSARLPVVRPGPLAPLLSERGELWSRWDRGGRLAAGLERRAATVTAVTDVTAVTAVTAVSDATAGRVPTPHPRLTASDDLIDELVAVDAAVVAEVYAVQAARARLRATIRARTRSGERARVLVRSGAAFVTVAITVVLVSVVR